MITFFIFSLMSSASGQVLNKDNFPNQGKFIVGGENTTIEEHPYQLSLSIFGFYLCGASIISRNWALTAAHCVDVVLPIYLIRAGSSIYDAGGRFYWVKEVIIHQDFGKPRPYNNDIGLIQIKGEFDIGNKQEIISLPEMGESVAEGTISVVTGWGRTTQGGRMSSILQKVSLPIFSEKLCKEIYKERLIIDNMLCAGYAEGGKDSCQGDSGGPMVINGKQFGIVSWGEGCGKPEIPGVYTRVAAFRDWISTKIGG